MGSLSDALGNVARSQQLRQIGPQRAYRDGQAVVDGRLRFGCSLREFYQQPVILSRLARFGRRPPLDAEVAGPEHAALARVNVYDQQPRWIVDCPDCGTGAEYVWLEGPHLMLCVSCGNVGIGYQWRPVLVPTFHFEIEALLLKRPDPTTRNWNPGESLDQLRAENASLGVT